MAIKLCHKAPFCPTPLKNSKTHSVQKASTADVKILNHPPFPTLFFNCYSILSWRVDSSRRDIVAQGYKMMQFYI